MQSRYPPPQYRLKAEDTLVQKASDGSSGPLSPSGSKKDTDLDDTRDQLDDLQQNVEIRNKQFQESKNFADQNEDDDDDDDDEDEEKPADALTGPSARASMKAGGALVFQRKKEGY